MRFWNKWSVLIAAVLLLSSCASAWPGTSLPGTPHLPSVASHAGFSGPPGAATTVAPAATPRLPSTPTAFPVSPTPTWFTPSFTPSPTGFPAQAAPLDLPAGVQVLLLLGTDNFAPYAGRTDTILLLFLNPSAGAASLVSIPRDLWVYQPGQGMDRINSAYATGGVPLLLDTFEYNVGVRPQHWGLAHLDDFWRFVDDLGGIDVPVSTSLPGDCGGISAGTVHMDGMTALCYVRSRYSTSDFDRSRRQQEVLQVIFQRFMSLENLPRLPEWYGRYRETVHTDLDLTGLLELAPLALRLQGGNGLHRYQVGLEQVEPWTDPESGAAVLQPQPEKVRSVLQSALDAVAAPESWQLSSNNK